MSTHDKFYSVTLRWILKVTAKEDGSTYTESGTTDVGASGNSLDDAIASAKSYLRDHLVHNYSGWHGKRCDMTKADVTMTSVEAKIVFSGKIAVEPPPPEDLLRKWAPVTRRLPLSGLSQIEEASAVLDKTLREGGDKAVIAACDKIRADVEKAAGWQPKDPKTSAFAPEEPMTSIGMPMKTMGVKYQGDESSPPEVSKGDGKFTFTNPEFVFDPKNMAKAKVKPDPFDDGINF